MNAYSTQPLIEFIDQLRLLAELQNFGAAFIAKLDELAALADQEAELEQLEQDRKDLQTRIAELEAREGAQ
jgi:cell division protein FtsB